MGDRVCAVVYSHRAAYLYKYYRRGTYVCVPLVCAQKQLPPPLIVSICRYTSVLKGVGRACVRVYISGGSRGMSIPPGRTISSTDKIREHAPGPHDPRFSLYTSIGVYRFNKTDCWLDRAPSCNLNLRLISVVHRAATSIRMRSFMCIYTNK